MILKDTSVISIDTLSKSDNNRTQMIF